MEGKVMEAVDRGETWACILLITTKLERDAKKGNIHPIYFRSIL
jgi:hypothetical protein